MEWEDMGNCEINYMFLSISEAQRRAKRNLINSKDANLGIEITCRLRPRWIAWILNRFYRPLSIYIEYGKIENGELIVEKSEWSATVEWTQKK